MYILGVFRRTALWGIILVILEAVSMGSTELLSSLVFFIGSYILIVLIHILACKIRKRSDSVADTYFSALGYDLGAPFTKIGLFIAVLFKKWVIRDNSKFHNFVDGLQVVTGGIWAMAVWGIAIYFILNMVL